MKKYFVMFSFVLIVLVGVCGLALANSTTQDDLDTENTAAAEEAMMADWEKTIDIAETVMFYGPESVLDETADIVTTENEAMEVYGKYEAGLDEIFSKSEKEVCISSHENYAEDIEMREEVMADSNQYLSEFVGFGNFDIEILEYTIDGDTAVVNVMITGWAKLVEQGHDNSGFQVTFPIDKCIESVRMVFDGETWKHDKWTIVSGLIMDSDESLVQTFPTYEEAVAYANSVTPKNVLADEIVEIIEVEE